MNKNVMTVSRVEHEKTGYKRPRMVVYLFATITSHVAFNNRKKKDYF